jgi:hypothetical protein
MFVEKRGDFPHRCGKTFISPSSRQTAQNHSKQPSHRWQQKNQCNPQVFTCLPSCSCQQGLAFREKSCFLLKAAPFAVPMAGKWRATRSCGKKRERRKCQPSWTPGSSTCQHNGRVAEKHFLFRKGAGANRLPMSLANKCLHRRDEKERQEQPWPRCCFSLNSSPARLRPRIPSGGFP